MQPAKRIFGKFQLYASPSNLASAAVNAQTAIPQAVGTAIENSVHFALRVSRAIVKTVVEHGQCISENNIVLSAVSHVQPLLRSARDEEAAICERAMRDMP